MHWNAINWSDLDKAKLVKLQRANDMLMLRESYRTKEHFVGDNSL